MKLRLTDYDDNTYMDTNGSCELCMYISGWESDWGHHNVKYDVNVPLFTYWLHDAEFKELNELAQEARLRGLDEDETDPWHTALDAILWSASYQSSEEELNKALSWALINKTA